MALRRTDVASRKGLMKAATPEGYGPQDLRDAYDLPADGGLGQTIAIVDAYDDPTAEADLAIYREQFGLPACTSANGCFSKVDQRGGTVYPTANPDWSTEISLDLDAVSAVAPLAHILLVEADDNSFESLGAGVDTAVSLGARVVSNSYGTSYTPDGGGESSSDLAANSHYDHPGVAIVASSGDSAYGVTYPAASPYVTAAGGTALSRDAGSVRGWSESVWHDSSSGAGSGCSTLEPKPVFQVDEGCAHRTVADVSAVADPATGVAVYQGYGRDSWLVLGGTSLSAPVVAGVYADAGALAAGTYPNAYPYWARHKGLNDVTAGSNGTCATAYLCTAGPGYDGPTGLGTPHGLAAFRPVALGVITGTVTDAATKAPLAGVKVSIGNAAARTDTDGRYTMTVPTGDYDLTGDSYGFYTGSASLTVTEGKQTHADLALRPKPTVKLSGHVVDGSGHGWPLYAQVTLAGVPGAPLWTDPVTGAFSVRVPGDSTYKLQIDSATPGYPSVTKSLHVGTKPDAVILAMGTDPFAGTTPAGYQLVEAPGADEAFSKPSEASGWSVANAAGTSGGWAFDNPGARDNTTGGTGGFAVVDSDFYGPAAAQDSSLVSPPYDLRADVSPELTFRTDLPDLAGVHTVDVSVDDGRSWTTLWDSHAHPVKGPARVTVPLTGYAGRSGVRVRFHYADRYDYWWKVDDVHVGDRKLVPLTGGLLVGTATDANTGKPLLGAVISAKGADPSSSTATVATTQDPAQSDGFYSLFVPKETRVVSGAKSGYATLLRQVAVPVNKAARMPLVLRAGLITTAASVTASLPSGHTATRTLRIVNSGTATATVSLNEAPGQDSAAKHGAPSLRVPGTFPLNGGLPKVTAGRGDTKHPDPAPVEGAWSPVADAPDPVLYPAVAEGGGMVYSAFGTDANGGLTAHLNAFDPATSAWRRLADGPAPRTGAAAGFIAGRLVVVGGSNTASGQPDASVDVYDPVTKRWSTNGATNPYPYAFPGSAVIGGKLYVVGGCGLFHCGIGEAEAYDPVTDVWTQIASYPEPISHTACGALAGRLYCAGGTTSANRSLHAYVYDPATDTWSRIADLPGPVWGAASTGINGRLVISGGVVPAGSGLYDSDLLTNQTLAYDPATNAWHALANAPAPLLGAGAVPGMYVIGGGVPGGVTSAVQVLVGYDQPDPGDVGWLTVHPHQLTLRPHESVTVRVRFDALRPKVSGPGRYRAKLVVGTDTPYLVPVVPVTLHVRARG